MAGATPKEHTSHKESSSLPNSPWQPSKRAALPSQESAQTAKTIKMAAQKKSCLKVKNIERTPNTKLKPLMLLGTMRLGFITILPPDNGYSTFNLIALMD